MRVLAVDFGTSNTVAALGVDGGAPRLVTIDGSPLVPSSVFLTDDGTLAVGRDADRQARIDPSRYEPNPKRRIDDGFILLGAAALPVTMVIAEVLKRVHGEVRRQLGGEPDQVRLTHPARWGQRRRDTLIAAANEAGFGHDLVLIPEPVAAATHFASTLAGPGVAGLHDGQALAVYDLGGGTFDIAVVARRGADYEVVAEAGLPDLGGLDFDNAITEHIGATHAAEHDAAAWKRLLQPTDAASRRQARVLATDVRDGKEALSRYPHVDIALPQPFPDVHLTRSEFEDLIRPNLQRSVDLMARTIADAGYDPRQLAGVYLVGGSSRIPLVARLIQQGLGITPTTLDQPETSVVTGALYLPVGAQAPAAAGPVAAPAGMPSGMPSGPVPAQGPYPAMPPFQPGYPTGPQQPVRAAGPPSMGYPSGGQPVVANPNVALPQLNVRSAVPASQLRPLDGPHVTGPNTGPTPAYRGAPAGGPDLLGGGRPPQPRGSRRGLAVGAVAVALVGVLTVIAILYATKGDGGGGGNPQASGSSGTNQGSASGNGTAGGTLDQYFDDDVILGYVRPAFDQIDRCQRGFTDSNNGSTTGIPPVPYTTTCFFKNGVQAAFAKAVSAESMELFRTSIAKDLPVAGLNQKKNTWTNGVVDEYTGTSELVGLFWTDNRTLIYAFATVPKNKLSISKLREWWSTNFGKD
jgi:actin-like ATPase involved in cell morphogenesis